MAGTVYTVTVDLTPATLEAFQQDPNLQQNPYILYGFSVVAGPPEAGAVIWFQTTELSSIITLTWTATYSVYTAQTQAIGGGAIVATDSYPLSPTLQQTLTLAPPAGIGTLSNGGAPGAVTVVNNTTTEYICGLAAPAPAGSTPGAAPPPICAASLYGNNEVILTPGSSIFLMFATQPFATGSVVEQTFGEGILIPLSPTSATASVAYDINQGWGGAGTPAPPGTSFTALQSS